MPTQAHETLEDVTHHLVQPQLCTVSVDCPACAPLAALPPGLPTRPDDAFAPSAAG